MGIKISVCMATYNGAEFLRPQLDSILAQLSESDELIISDDGSSDDTVQIAEAYQDSRIKIYHSVHRNVVLNFENALHHASGDIIFLADQDDIWYPDRIKKSAEALQLNTLVFSNANVFDGEFPVGEQLLYTQSDHTGFLKNLVKNNYIGATMAFRSGLLKVALPFPKHIPMHDMWLGMLAEIIGKTAYIKTPLIYYRRHSENLSTTGRKSGYSVWKKFQFRTTLLALLTARIIKRTTKI